MNIVVGYDDYIGPWICQRLGLEWYEGKGKCIGLLQDGVLIAGTLYEGFNGSSVFMHIAIDKPVTKQWIRTNARYVFIQLNAKRVSGMVAATNIQAREFLQRVGFIPEVSLHNACVDGDLIIYTIFKEECRWL